jgi:hypothetical protein
VFLARNFAEKFNFEGFHASQAHQNIRNRKEGTA